MTPIGVKQVAAIAAKVAPWVGGTMVLAALEADGRSDLGTEIWRVTLSVILGIFVALAGTIYRDVNRRIAALEAARDGFVPRKEYDERHNDVKESLNRIEAAIMGRKV